MLPEQKVAEKKEGAPAKYAVQEARVFPPAKYLVKVFPKLALVAHTMLVPTRAEVHVAVIDPQSPVGDEPSV